MKEKLNLVAGKKYRGYGVLNEYGEFEFTPEQTGSRPDRLKVIKSGQDYNISTTKNYVVLHFKLRKAKVPAMLQQFTSMFNLVWNTLRTYEI